MLQPAAQCLSAPDNKQANFTDLHPSLVLQVPFPFPRQALQPAERLIHPVLQAAAPTLDVTHSAATAGAASQPLPAATLPLSAHGPVDIESQAAAARHPQACARGGQAVAQTVVLAFAPVNSLQPAEQIFRTAVASTWVCCNMNRWLLASVLSPQQPSTCCRPMIRCALHNVLLIDTLNSCRMHHRVCYMSSLNVALSAADTGAVRSAALTLHLRVVVLSSCHPPQDVILQRRCPGEH